MRVARKESRTTDHRTRVGHERSARTELRILDAALGVFAEMGPDAPTIDHFVEAAAISRGTFYNYFESVDELLAATSEWVTSELIDPIEPALADIEGEALRFGVALRLLFVRAQTNPFFCRFVARVWSVTGIELPMRDLQQGLRTGVFRAPSPESARDLVSGAVREAMLRIRRVLGAADYGTEIVALCLQALGIDSRRVTAILKHPLPRIPAPERSTTQ